LAVKYAFAAERMASSYSFGDLPDVRSRIIWSSIASSVDLGARKTMRASLWRAIGTTVAEPEKEKAALALAKRRRNGIAAWLGIHLGTLASRSASPLQMPMVWESELVVESVIPPETYVFPHKRLSTFRENR
jgi:hypothetical protein